MEHCRVSYQNWAIATYLSTTNLKKGMLCMKIHKDLGVTQRTAWFMVHRLRESWKNLAGVDKMSGSIEIDEAFFGGLEKNKHKGKKYTSKKTAGVGAKDRSTDKITATAVPETAKARLEDFIENTIDKDATKHTDENPSCSDLTNHETVNHSIGECVNGVSRTNGLESFWACIGHGTFHHTSGERLHHCINEFAARRNIRDGATINTMDMVAENMV